MSFLWGGASNQEVVQGENKCRDCIDKNKRLVDYDLFFNELQNVLKKKEGEISELQNTIKQQNNTINELNTMNENTEFSVITLNAHKGRLEREIEKQKEFFQEEKKKWMDDKLAFEDIQSKIHDELVFYRELNVKLENDVEDLEDEKLIWKQHKKVLDEKIELITKELQETKNKSEAIIQALEAKIIKKEEEEKDYQERIDEISENFRISEEQYLELAKKYARDMLMKEEDFREKEEELIAQFREKIENLEEALDEKENLWQSREEEYEFMIQRYQENEDEYELKIQELKYETEYEMDRLVNAYRKKEDETLEYWEGRIEELNQNYDDELLKFKDKVKARENALNQEKEYLEFDLRKEIEDLKMENEKIISEKKELEKKKLEVVLENKGLKSDNEWLELQWNQEQELIERLRNEKEDLEEAQKKMESELLNLKEEMVRNQRILEESLTEKSIMESKLTQCNIEENNESLEENFWKKENHMDMVDQAQNDSEVPEGLSCKTSEDSQEEVDLISSCIQGGLRKRNQYKKKNKKYLNEDKTTSSNHFVHPSVYEMDKEDENSKKKTFPSNAQKVENRKIQNRNHKNSSRTLWW